MKANLIRMKDTQGNIESFPKSHVEGAEMFGWQKIDENGKRIPVTPARFQSTKAGLNILY